MVKLIGVVHGLTLRNIFGNLKHLNLHPSERIINYIQNLHKNSRIGIESLSYEEFKEVSNEINNRNMVFIERDSYWEDIINIIRENGHQLFYLEEKAQWIKIIDAKRELGSKLQEELIREENESYESYNLRSIKLNEEVDKLKINYRKIHEIDRDIILRKNALNDLELAIVGRAHSDLWVNNGKNDFEEYHTDNPIELKKFEYYMEFKKNDVPKSEILIASKNLQRLIKLLETGRLTPEKNPDYVGTFDYHNPLLGYFEVFLENKKSGTIVDSFGEAKIEGTFLEDKIDFIKNYTLSESRVVKGPIRYIGSVLKRLFSNGEIYGCFSGKTRMGDFSNIFMMSKEKLSPLELSVSVANSWPDEEMHYNQFR